MGFSTALFLPLSSWLGDMEGILATCLASALKQAIPEGSRPILKVVVMRQCQLSILRLNSQLQ
jgi:hypothetical protein